MKIFKNRLFILGMLVVIFIVILSGVVAWFLLYADNTNVSESYLVPQKSETTSTTGKTIDQDVAEIETEVNSVSSDDYADSQLQESTIGL